MIPNTMAIATTVKVMSLAIAASFFRTQALYKLDKVRIGGEPLGSARLTASKPKSTVDLKLFVLALVVPARGAVDVGLGAAGRQVPAGHISSRHSGSP
jgi:hypothetical protein